ncbi:MAG: N,N-dimethylformamidase beta subunit family domain-containing protein, partial [Gammaproteobacteria bacterium]
SANDVTWCAPPSNTPFLICAHRAAPIADRWMSGAHYNGKVERPVLLGASVDSVRARSLVANPNTATAADRVLAAWDFSEQIPSATVVDRSPNRLHGRTVNLPARGVTGHDWDGSADDWRLRPQAYGAIHFHDDDLYDCGWSTDFALTVPIDWPSGFYAARLRSPGAEGYVAFFVRPPRDAATASIAFVAATATYMSYANTHIKFDSLNTENLYESLTPISEDELYLNEHRELGLSHYDTHSDQSGVFYASRLRPMLNFRPGLYTFNYLNDTHIVYWLAARGFECDIITDEDVHEDGAALLARYPVVITGSHPEYTSTRMWDAFDAYQRGGGRHMYLGGNGFYWRIAYSDEFPGVIENRRGITGVRTWEGEPGEHHLSFTGEPAGLWRSNGRAPQKLVGVGFSATLFNRSTYYLRTAAGRSDRHAFVFEGVPEDERIGDFGLRGGGAAGLEIDRWDAALGSPPDSAVIATSHDIGIGGLLSVEEYVTTTRALDGIQNGRVRADMVLFATPNGGAVWSTGSIAWATSLFHNDGENNVSRITENVLRRFLNPEPLDSAREPGNGKHQDG